MDCVSGFCGTGRRGLELRVSMLSRVLEPKKARMGGGTPLDVVLQVATTRSGGLLAPYGIGIKRAYREGHRQQAARLVGAGMLRDGTGVRLHVSACGTCLALCEKKGGNRNASISCGQLGNARLCAGV